MEACSCFCKSAVLAASFNLPSSSSSVLEAESQSLSSWVFPPLQDLHPELFLTPWYLLASSLSSLLALSIFPPCLLLLGPPQQSTLATVQSLSGVQSSAGMESLLSGPSGYSFACSGVLQVLAALSSYLSVLPRLIPVCLNIPC